MNKRSIAAALMLFICLTLGSSAAHAAEPPVPPASEQPTELQEMRDAVTAIRQELAATKLELQTAQRQLRALRDYLASSDPKADIQKWTVQQQALEDERAQVALERKRLEAARQSLRDATRAAPATR